MTALTHKRAKVNGVTLHYAVAGAGPVVLCMHGWPQNHREFLPVIDGLTDRYTFIAPDLRGYADSEKPLDGYDPLTIAADMLALLDVEAVEKFHILSHDLGGPPSVALAYLAADRALSIATIETPFFGLDYPGYTDPQVRLLASGNAHARRHHAVPRRRPRRAVPPALLPRLRLQPNRDAGKRSATVRHAHAPARQPPRRPQPLRGHSADGGAGRRTDEDRTVGADVGMGWTGVLWRRIALPAPRRSQSQPKAA